MAIREKAAPRPASSTGETTGWDPYEVWRTRVLLPQLANQKRNRAPQAAAVETLVSPLLADQRVAADRRASGNDEALRHELRVAISYLLLAGISGLFDSDAKTGRNRPLAASKARHARPNRAARGAP